MPRGRRITKRKPKSQEILTRRTPKEKVTTQTAAANLAEVLQPAQTASTGFVRRPVEPVAPVVPAQTATPGFVRRPVTAPVIRPPKAPTITSIPAASQVGRWLGIDTPTQPDIDQRRYTLPRFGEREVEFDNVLEHRQLVEAARLTGDAMFTYGKLPSVISTDVARELPFNPTSKLFQDMMQESFGVSGFDTPEEFLTRLGYIEFAPGQWEIQDPITVTGYGDGVYQGGGTSPYRGIGYSAARGYGSDYGYRTGSTLVNWRI